MSSSFMDKAKDVANQAVDRATKLAGEVAEKAGPLAEQAAEKAGPLAERAADLAAKGVDTAASSLDKVTHGKYSEQIHNVSDKVGEFLDRDKHAHDGTGAAAGADAPKADPGSSPGTEPPGAASSAPKDDEPKNP